MPIGIVAQIAGAGDIGHMEPIHLPVMALVGGGMCLWFPERYSEEILKTPGEEHVYRLTGQTGDVVVLPRPGLLVHLTDPATGRTWERWTDARGVADFGNEEPLRRSTDPLTAEVEVDRRVLLVELPFADSLRG